jgi:NAD(P)-dependent dehydrogenase (short-subunit alcohol dehydrogenase family)
VGALDGRIAVITGAGRGLGREHALLFAREGARVVVNDVGATPAGAGADQGPAQDVVDEIRAAGGEAVVNTDSVASWDGAQRMIQQTQQTFGDLHVVVNNAGILRDRDLVDMSEEEWDAVIDVNMKGHFCVAHHASSYWRERSAAGVEVKASLINTSSGAGLMANAGHANYAGAKAGVAAMTIAWAVELAPYGVRVNCIAPSARTRLAELSPGMSAIIQPPDDGSFDFWHPANVSPLVAYLATTDCPFNGAVLTIGGSQIALAVNWTVHDVVMNDGRRWTVEGLAEEAPKLLEGRAGGVASRGAHPAEFKPKGFTV